MARPADPTNPVAAMTRSATAAAQPSSRQAPAPLGQAATDNAVAQRYPDVTSTAERHPHPAVIKSPVRIAVVQPTATEVDEDPMKSVASLTGLRGRIRRIHGLTVRVILAAAVLMPIAAFTIMLAEPFAISAIASTVAIVMHAPLRYHRHPQLILSCYAAGIAVSATISLAGVFMSVPPLMAAAVAAAIIVASPAGRLHPPTACIPLQVIAAIPPLALVGRWLTFTGLSLTCLFALWLLTARPLVQRNDADPCPAGSTCSTAV